MNVIKLVGGPHITTFKVLDRTGRPINGVRSISINRIDVDTGFITAIIETEVELDLEVQVRKDDMEENSESS